MRKDAILMLMSAVGLAILVVAPPLAIGEPSLVGPADAEIVGATPHAGTAKGDTNGAILRRGTADDDIVGALADVTDKGGPTKSADQDGAPAGLENALWGIPLASLNAARQRPIFSPTRRPPPTVAAAPVAQPKPAALVPAQSRPRLLLIGAVAGETDGFAIFVDETVPSLIRMRTGEGYSGWTLREVKGREATLQRNNEIAVLELLPRSAK
jgi:hypothetical protein